MSSQFSERKIKSREMNSRLLIISNAALSSTDSNGRNLSRLVDCIDIEQKAQFFVYGIPDFNECNKFYQVSDSDALHSFIRRVKKDGRVRNIDRQVSDYTKKRRRKTPFRMLLRELSWKCGRWNNIYLKKWIEEINPACILVVAGDNRFTLDLARKIAKKRGLPIILYSTEEYPFKNYNYITKRFSLFYLIWRKLLRSSYKKISKHVKVGIFNTEALMKLYEREYGYKCYSIYQASNISWNENFKLEKDIKVSYLGNLGLNRHKALISIAEKLDKVCSGVKLDIYGNPDDTVRKELENCPYVCLKGFVPYEKVVEVIHKSTLLVHAEYKDKFYTRDLKYAFSTKITDSICAGTPLLIYAPEDLAETNFLKKNDCAFVASDNEELFEQLKLALTDENLRKMKLYHAKRVKEKYFINKGLFKEIVEEVLHENSSS